MKKISKCYVVRTNPYGEEYERIRLDGVDDEDIAEQLESVLSTRYQNCYAEEVEEEEDRSIQEDQDFFEDMTVSEIGEFLENAPEQEYYDLHLQALGRLGFSEKFFEMHLPSWLREEVPDLPSNA